MVGFILLGGGLLAVFVSELRAYRTADAHWFAEAAWYTATFYDALVLPGAVVVGFSGVLLIIELGLGLFSEPWLVGMWGLFLFELIEGNTITRREFQRTLRRSSAVLRTGQLTPHDREDARTWLGQITHFLDVPIFLAIVYYGAVRPDDWAHVLAAIAAALVAAAMLTSRCRSSPGPAETPPMARPSCQVAVRTVHEFWRPGRRRGASQPGR
jgi:Predicted integral membrane protein (DUF2269)